MSRFGGSGWFGSDNITHRLRSLPIKVHWAGFQSDTHRMEKSGWEISAHQDVASCQIQMAFRRGNLRGITAMLPLDHRREAYGWMETLSGGPPELIAEIRDLATAINIHHVGELPKFRPVDCTPQMWEGRITSLDDMAHFVPKEAAPQEIIVPEADVGDLLQKILDKQQPAREARAKAAYYEERDSGLLVPKVHAKIISLTDRAA